MQTIDIISRWSWIPVIELNKPRLARKFDLEHTAKSLSKTNLPNNNWLDRATNDPVN